MSHYDTLGVSKTATKEEIKRAYRKLALKHHPDHGGSEEEFKKINEAYSILGDDQKRVEYDLGGRRQSQSSNMRWDDVFGDFFGRHPFGHHRRQPTRPTPQQDSDLKFNLGITLEQIKRGASQRINYSRNVSCNPCSGKGGEGARRCESCGGTGVEEFYNKRGVNFRTQCRTCSGEGITFDVICGTCRGTGVLRKTESIVVKVSED